MLVKYIGNADKNEATAVITGLEAGYDIPVGHVGEVNSFEYGVISTRCALETVGDDWADLSKEDLEANAARLGVVLEGLSTPAEYASAIKNHRTSADEGEEETTTETPSPVTATPSGSAASTGSGAASPAGSPPPGNAGAGGGRS